MIEYTRHDGLKVWPTTKMPTPWDAFGVTKEIYFELILPKMQAPKQVQRIQVAKEAEIRAAMREALLKWSEELAPRPFKAPKI